MGQHAVNIAYPLNGGTTKNYFTASFSATCPGGQNKVEWGFDGTTIGNATFYDQFSAQFCHKLPTGAHTFWVKASCGENKVSFKIS
jgi:hypothetical protein